MRTTAGLEAGGPKPLKRLVLQANNAKSQPRGRFADPRRLFVICLALFAMSAFAHPEPNGYLASIGPSGLRFCSVPRPFTNIFVLPVIKPATNEPPTVATNSEPSHVVPTASATVPDAGTNQTQNVNVVDPGVPTNVVSPQMFLKYFSKSTNGAANATIITPLDFTPPRASPAPSSATYSTGP